MDQTWAERRSEPRYKASQVIKLTVMGEGGFTAPALIADVSLHGMGIKLHRPLQTGAEVKISLGDAVFIGRVCHCRPNEDGFTVGLRLEQALTKLGESTNLDRKLFEILRNFLVQA